MHQQALASALAVVLAAAPTAMANAIYTKNSPVLQVDAKNFDRLINRSNHTSIVEFYAPWCGHCQNLKPAYEKAARNLDGLAKVAAIDCDADANKQFCSQVGVKGFPTLKIVRPGKKPGRPVIEDYNGGRTAGAIVEAVASKINNHVTRVTDKDLDGFLAKGDAPKALLFTDKGTTSALLRSIAIDFLSVIDVAQVRNKESKAVAKFGIEKFPTLVLVPGEGQEPVVYEGDMKKDAMVKFLRQAGEPNPDPAPAKGKGDKKKSTKDKAKDKTKDKKPKAEKADKAEKAEKVEEPAEEAETPDAPPAASTPEVVLIPTVSGKQEVAEKCLQPKSHTCILALLPAAESDDGTKAVASLSQLNTKYSTSGRNKLPFLAVPDSVEDLAFIRETLGAKNAVELVAVNARRNWWRQYEGDFSAASVEAWVDTIKMGEGAKNKLPKGIVEAVEEPEEPKEESQEDPVEEPKAEDPEEVAPEMEDEEPKADEASDEHDEL